MENDIYLLFSLNVLVLLFIFYMVKLVSNKKKTAGALESAPANPCECTNYVAKLKHLEEKLVKSDERYNALRLTMVSELNRRALHSFTRETKRFIEAHKLTDRLEALEERERQAKYINLNNVLVGNLADAKPYDLNDMGLCIGEELFEKRLGKVKDDVFCKDTVGLSSLDVVITDKFSIDMSDDQTC